VRCAPEDAENTLDISTANAGNRIARIVYKHNEVPLLWVHALYVYVTEGLVACYHRNVTSKKFGTYPKDEYSLTDKEGTFCPECETLLDAELICPECDEQYPEATPEVKKVREWVGVTDHPKSRQVLDAYGGLHVKIPNYARTISQCPYLAFSEEIHYADAIEQYEDLLELTKGWHHKKNLTSSGHDEYERWGRLNIQYYNEDPIDVVTINKWWLRPSAFNVLNNEESELLHKKYPNGVLCTLANDEWAADPIEEDLDQKWTLTRNPLADHLTHNPLGTLLTSIQDITNTLVSLIIQTVEHGIPQTFVNPNTVDLKAYGKVENKPGSLFGARPQGGRPLNDSFHEIKTATLSGEVLPFLQRIQELGQLVSGALPSLFGGAASAGSNTAAEYSMSRAQALQRLQNTWKIFTSWWQEVFKKVIPDYIDNMDDDEIHVTRNEEGTFENVFLRKSEMAGRLGDIELEANEQLPMTWPQVRDVVMQLMEMQSPQMMAFLSSPENLPRLTEAIGLDRFKLPGTADRDKQHEEIAVLLKTEAMPIDEMGMEGPSVMPDTEVDNHIVHMEAIKSWAVSEVGRQAKLENPDGYKNVLLHFKMHQAVSMSPAANSNPLPPEGAEQGEFDGSEFVN
jgi:hypothetical protein